MAKEYAFMDIFKFVSQLTVEEKAALVSGTDFMYTNSIPRLKIPSLRMSDGPHGLRVQSEGGDNGVTGSSPATSFPTAATTASSWNPDNTKRMGEAIAKECLHYGVNILLGPATNIKRNPLCGRNFEYFSEDPLLAGEMAAAEVKGVQSKGVGISVKHFALNNAENFRFMGDSLADMRAIREIYLKVYERIVKQAHPYTMMCAYNKINGTYCSENKWLLNDVLRTEWGFDGAVMTDWGAVHERVESLKAGLDLEMPGDTAICRKRIIDGIASGELSMEDLDKAVTNILKLIERCTKTEKTDTVDWDENNKLASEIAEDSAVLLKNDGVLPLDKNKKYCVIGDLFEKMRYQGVGSSMINPTRLTTPKNAFDQKKIIYDFARGYDENKLTPQEDLIEEAIKKAKDHKLVLFFAGLTDYVESEGGDRENMQLPLNQLAMIDALIKANKKVVVILYGGSPIELPFADNVSAILNMYLPGQNGGTATRNLLFGEKTPSGKLAETWMKSYKDVPFANEYSSIINEIYKESIFVGYRYYATAKKGVQYPFGYGLSYTSFHIRAIQVVEEKDKIRVSCEVNNCGKYDGAEVVQIYVQGPKDGVFKPIRELRAFQKIYLKTGESKKVTLSIAKEDLRYWNQKENRWMMEKGEYAVEICSDANTVLFEHKIHLDGENISIPYEEDINEIYKKVLFDQVTNQVFEKMSGLCIPSLPPSKPITLESRFTDLRLSFLGKILYNAVLSVAKKDMKAAKKMPEGVEKENKIKGALFLKRILESNSLRSMSMSAGKSMPYNFANGFMHLANGKLFKGIKCFCTKIRVPKLPKEKEDI